MAENVNRRNFLSLVALTTSALAVSPEPAADAGVSSSASSDNSPQSVPQSVEVVVVGGGFAGLCAARKLKLAGRSVLVLEARDRLGGRTKTENFLDGVKLDVGGQWIGPGQVRVNRLVQAMQIPMFATYNSGKNLLEDRGSLRSYSGTIPRLGPASLVDLGAIMARLDRMASTIDPLQPWNHSKALEWDSVTLHSFLERHVQAGAARRALRVGLEMLLATTENRVSLLYTLFFIRTAGGLSPLLDVEGGAQQDRFQLGTASLVEKFAEPLNNRIVTGAAVREIRQMNGGVQVVSTAGTVIAKKVVLAIPPTLAARLQYDPPLSADRDQLTQAVPMGSVIKCFAFYLTPFWREQGLSGQVVSTSSDIAATFDNSVPGYSTGVLLGFAVAAGAERLRRLDPKERRRQVLDHFGRWFGAKARQPLYYVDHSWADEPWSRGCYFGHIPTGVLSALGQALRRPEGHLHFAGTETAVEWVGYIEGALESGERAAEEVLAVLAG